MLNIYMTRSWILRCTSTLKYHAADKHDAPTSYFKLTLNQPVLH